MQHDLYSPREAADYCGLSLSKFNQLHSAGTGPRYSRLGTEKTARLVFQRKDLDRWLNGRGADTVARAKRYRELRRAVERATAERKKTHEAESRFRKQLSEIISGAPHFGIDDLRGLMTRSGYTTIRGIPADQRDKFLTALVDAAMSGGSDND